MFSQIRPADALKKLSCSQSAHYSTMRTILEQGLLSPLSHPPLQISLTDGLRVKSLYQAHLIITKYLHPLETPKEVTQCKDMILDTMDRTCGNFLLSLPEEYCRQTAISPYFARIEMRPIGALGWKLIIGDGVERPEILHGVGAQSLKVGERLTFPLSPIPNMHGASGFSTNATRDALLASPLFAAKVRRTEDNNSPSMVVESDRGRFKISCSLGFWVQGDVFHRDGHYAFAPEQYGQLPQYKAHVSVDFTPLSENDTEFFYVDSPPCGITEIMNNVSEVIADNFYLRSPNRKKTTLELMTRSACS